MDFKVSTDRGRNEALEFLSVCGVPKHSELEPDYCLAARGGNAPQSSRLDSAHRILSPVSALQHYPLFDWNPDKGRLVNIFPRGTAAASDAERVTALAIYGFLRWVLLAGLAFNSTKIASKG